jgi:outer membrane protein assembly factor BamB
MLKSTYFVLIGLYAVSLLQAQEISHWRGPSRNGIYPEKGLLKSWPSEGPQILWSAVGLGVGHSSPAIDNNKIYISGMIGSTGHIFVFSVQGELLGKYPYGEEFTESHPGTRSTPTVAGDHLYIMTGLGKLLCMNADDGKVRWQKDLFRDFDGRNIQWGVTENLLIDGDILYCAPGGRTNNIVALNRFNGDLVWSSKGTGDKSAYCSPLLVHIGGRKLLVTMMADHIVGIDAGNGTMLWSYAHQNRTSVHPNTPIYYQGSLFCFSGYGKGGVKLRLSADGSEVAPEWTSTSLESKMGGAVLVNEYIYVSGDANRQWFCIDPETGQNQYQSTAIFKGNIISADGMLICYSERGELALVQPDPEQFNIISQTRVELGSLEHWSHPVIHEGIMYLRHGDALIAYKIT